MCVCVSTQASSEDLYDVIQSDTKRRTGGVSVQAMKSMWDQRSLGSNDGESLPALPPKATRRPQSNSQVRHTLHPHEMFNVKLIHE